MKYNYINDHYSKVEGKTFEQLETELKIVFIAYEEYHDGGFHQMVEKMAKDPFYNLYYVAREYLEIEEWLLKE